MSASYSDLTSSCISFRIGGVGSEPTKTCNCAASNSLYRACKDRDSGTVRARPVSDTTVDTLGGVVDENVEADAIKYTDDNKAYHNLPNHHTVNHHTGEYVRDMVHVNGIESFWALLKRGYHGVFHHISFRHLHRFINKFAGRLNIRDMDTIDMMSGIVQGMVGKRLMYKSLVA